MFANRIHGGNVDPAVIDGRYSLPFNWFGKRSAYPTITPR
jgi:hypothetical protein